MCLEAAVRPSNRSAAEGSNTTRDLGGSDRDQLLTVHDLAHNLGISLSAAYRVSSPIDSIRVCRRMRGPGLHTGIGEVQ